MFYQGCSKRLRAVCLKSLQGKGLKDPLVVGNIFYYF